MSESPIQLLVAAFEDENRAEQVLKELKAAKKEKLIGIEAAVALRRDEKGKLHTKDVKLTPGKGALRGGAIGLVLGVVTGGAALAIGAGGAAIGALVGKRKKNQRFSPERIDQIADSLQPGTSAVVAVIEHKWVAELEQEFEEAGADVMTTAIAADIAEQLGAGRDVAYSAVADEAGLTTSRVAAGEDEEQVSTTTFTDDAIEHAATVINEEGMAAKHVVVTAEGIAAEGIVATEEGVTYAAGVVTDEGEAGILATAPLGNEDDADTKEEVVEVEAIAEEGDDKTEA